LCDAVAVLLEEALEERGTAGEGVRRGLRDRGGRGGREGGGGVGEWVGALKLEIAERAQGASRAHLHDCSMVTHMHTHTHIHTCTHTHVCTHLDGLQHGHERHARETVLGDVGAIQTVDTIDAYHPGVKVG
jgi:hypothetical protein